MSMKTIVKLNRAPEKLSSVEAKKDFWLTKLLIILDCDLRIDFCGCSFERKEKKKYQDITTI